MEETLKLFFLAIVQGVTEFLPISSSGHLSICKELLGLDSPGVRVEVMLHCGTLLAVIAYYHKTLRRLAIGLFSGERHAIREVFVILLGCLPAAFAALTCGDWIERQYDGKIAFTACMLLITGVLLISLKFLKGRGSDVVSPPKALLTGVAQAFALLPGISRSGSTIACARYLGISGKKAADFSFLMSIPLLLGATVLHLLSSDFSSATVTGAISWKIMLPAMLLSAVIGYVSIKLLLKLISGRHFWLFGIYCLAAGAALLLLPTR